MYEVMRPVKGYRADKWVLVEITFPDGTVERKVFSGNGGGYLNGADWRLSTNIVKEEVCDDGFIIFTTASGSQYEMRKTGHGMTGYMAGVWDGFARNPNHSDYKFRVLEDYSNG